MRNWICAIALTLSFGCASANFRPYIGQQQSWPTANGSIVNMKYNYPVFTSLPSTPYEVLGELRIESPFYQYPEEGHMPVLIKKAKELNADAVVFVEGDVFFSTNYGPRPGDAAAGGAQPTLTQVNRFNPESFKPGVNILAIRWIGEPPPELAKTAPPPPAAEAAPAPKEEMTKPEEAAPTNAAPAESATPPVALPSEETNQPPAATEQPAPPPAEQPTPPPAEQPAPAPESP
jgi:outer membrane biosynthesis protein TonB